MKVMALYDIHGNVDALEAVLADARAGRRAGRRRRRPRPVRRRVLDRLDR
jgi:hypothetical protein